MLLRLLFMFLSGESDGNKQSKLAAQQRRQRTIDRLNKAKQNKARQR